MSTEENKAVVRRYYEEGNKRNMAALEELLAPHWVWHGPELPGQTLDPAGLRQMRIALWTAFPDMQVVVENLIAEGDKVACRTTLRGTHQGDFMGMPPTGKRGSLTGTEIDRIEDGKFVESWGDYDMLGFLQQLGVIPQLAQART